MEGDLYTSPFNNDTQQEVYNPINDQNPVPTDPISLDIPDQELSKVIKERRETSKKFYENRYNLKARREKNEEYLFGRQIQSAEKNNELKTYESRVNDNVLWEIEASLKPLAMSHLPDMIVTPGSPDPQKIETAKQLSIAIDDQNKKIEQREVLGMGFRHLPVYFTAVVKAIWNPEIDDYQFKNVHPDYIIASHTAKTNNAQDMDFISECTPTTVQELFMRFPNKKEEIITELKTKGLCLGEKPTWKDLASEVEIWETWFTWYKKSGKDDTSLPSEAGEPAGQIIAEPGDKWEKIEGVVWQLEDIILKKIKDPNYDWQGQEKLFTYDIPGDENTKREVQPQEVLMSAMTGEMMNYVKETQYFNYFQFPKKPYYFFGYDQWGKIPYDETSRIEQNLRNQEGLDTQEKQIVDTLKARTKHIWSKDGGMTSEAVQNMDMDNPKLDALVEGDVNSVHKSINPERPDAAQFNNVDATRQRMYSLAGANAIRGDLQSDVATTNQIAREADYTRADDLVMETVNNCSEWMAQWQMQFIKLRYTEDHLRQILGAKGSMVYIKLRRDMIEDGMEVMIKSSSTDKLKAQRNSIEMAKLKLIDPISFYEDMGISDPEGRTQKLMMFTTDPMGYMVKYAMGLQNTGQMTAALNGSPEAPANQPTEQQITPQAPSVQDTSNVASEPTLGVSASPQV